MAAGIGSRYGGLKQVDPVGPGGELVMDYAVYDAAQAGIERAVFVIRRDLERDFHDLRGSRYARLLDVAYAFQELDDVPPGFAVPQDRRKPWGTAHAILAARGQVAAPFLAINADDFYGRSALRRLADFLRDGAASGDWALVAYELQKTLSAHGGVARGICDVAAEGTLRGIEEHTALERAGDGVRGLAPDGAVRLLSGGEPASMNLWGFRTDLFAHLEERFARFLAARGGEAGAELYLPSVVGELVGEGKATVRVLRSADPWFGVTYREDREEVAAGMRGLIAAGVYPQRLWG